MRFKLFLEEYKDIFGFSDEIGKLSRPETKIIDENPIMPFNSSKMMEYLASQPVGNMPSFQAFSNEVQWGKEAGAIKVRLGSQYTIYIERLIHDLQGDPQWICKKVFKVNTEEYQKYVESVSDSLHEEVKRISQENLDAPRSDYNNVKELAEMVAEEVNSYANDIFVFDKLKHVNENNSLVVYNVKGTGRGYLLSHGGHSYINQIIVDLHFVPELGILESNLTAVVSSSEGISWHIAPSFFSGVYVPTQPLHEIATTVVTALKWF